MDKHHFMTPGSDKLFVRRGFNHIAWRFGSELKWQPVKFIRMFGLWPWIQVDDGEGFFDTPNMFYLVDPKTKEAISRITQQG